MPSVQYFTWHLASPISHIGLYTKQTQIIQHKTQELKKNVGMFNVNSFCHLHSFCAHCFYPIVELICVEKTEAK